ncbi:MAG: RNA methyltransferase [Flavobacteriales bacterium]
MELLNSRFDVQAIYYTELGRSSRFDSFKGGLVTTKEMSQITALATASPVLAIVSKTKQTSDQIALSQQRVLILDSIRDPGNLGTIIRSADWFGIKTIVASLDTVDVFNPKVIQATMGSVFRVEVDYQELYQLAEWKIRNPEFKFYGAMLEGKPSNTLRTCPGFGGLIIGNESFGISNEIQALIDTPVTIERIGKAESLNASVSAAILLYEWCGLSLKV